MPRNQGSLALPVVFLWRVALKVSFSSHVQARSPKSLREGGLFMRHLASTAAFNGALRRQTVYRTVGDLAFLVNYGRNKDTTVA